MSKFDFHREKINSEHVMLVVLLGFGILFFTLPITEDYPNDARVFPQMMGAVVAIGSALLLGRNYLPGPLRRFVAEDVSLAAEIEEEEIENIGELQEIEPEAEVDAEDGSEKGPPLHVAWGYDVNNTIVMMAFSTVYFALGWAAGFLYVTPIFVFVYTYWFRVKWYKGVVLAILATLIIYGFVELLLMPFDRGELIFERGLV